MGKPYRDKEWLHEKYVEEGKSSTQISRDVGVTRGTILNWLEKHDIPRRKSGPDTGENYGNTDQLKDESWLKEQYLEKELSSEQIAREIGCSSQSVLDWLERHGIERRSNTNLSGKLFSLSVDERIADPDWLREQVVEKGRAQKDVADELGVSQAAVSMRLSRFGIR